MEEPVDENSASFSFSGDITEEDIDSALLEGSHVVGGKFRIYQQFVKEESNADNIRFLKDEYGIGGGAHYYPDGLRGQVNFDGKGLKLDKQGVEEPLLLSWAKVNARIKTLVADGKYLSREQIDAIPAYAEWQRLRIQRANAEHELFMERNRLFNEALQNRAFQIEPGTTVYVDGADHQVIGVTGGTVTLADPDYPLLQKTKNKADLLDDMAINERWRNQDLLVVAAPETVVPDVPSFERWLEERKVREQPSRDVDDTKYSGQGTEQQTENPLVREYAV